MKQIRPLILVLFCSIHVSGQNTDYIFEQISSDAGITFNALSSIVEDKYGFIWFGSSNGLFCFNYSEIVKYSFDPQKSNTPPSNNINVLYRDQGERIWVCTTNGLCFFNEAENSFSRIPLKEEGKLLQNPRVTGISQLDESNFLSVINSRLYKCDLNHGEIEHVEIEENTGGISYLAKTEEGLVYIGTTTGQIFVNNESEIDFRLLYSSNKGSVSTLCFTDRHLWIGYDENGIDLLDREGRLVYRYSQESKGDYYLPSNQVRKIIQRRNRDIWVGTQRGILVISLEGNTFIRPDNINGLPHEGIFELFPDRHGGIWVGTWSGGLSYFHDLNYKFPHIKETVFNTSLSKNVISSFAENGNGDIWIGSENNGLSNFDLDNMRHAETEMQGYEWPISRIKSIEKGLDNKYWFGTLYEGLWVLENGRMARIGDVSGIFSSLLAVEDGIWVGDRQSGLIFYDFNKKTFSRFLNQDSNIGSISSNQIWDIFQDSRGNLWICSDFGLSVRRKGEEDFTRYYHNEKSNSLSRNMTYSIAEDRTGKLWIGTSGGGIDIYDPVNDEFSRFSLNESIETADVYCILRDNRNNMWFSSNQGIYVYNFEASLLKGFNQQDGLLGNQYHPNSGFISSSGMLFFGGGNGFNIIDPDAVRQNEIVPDAYLSKLLVNNSSLEEQVPRFINSKFISGIERLELDYNQNSITVGFVANNIIKANNNKFRYRIQNYQDEWTEISQGEDASFTKIPPGEYVLEVIASNNTEVWSRSPKKIQIKIFPPFWQAWYAYLFYIALLSFTLYMIIRGQRFRARSKAEKLLFSEKVTFFTNVSHEFRTPLTLILSPLNSLIKKVTYDPEMTDQVSTVKRNADRLLRLTNQLLDFRMIELNKSNLRVDKKDLVAICRNVYDCFEFQVEEKEINMIFSSSFKTLVLPVDEEKIDKVVYNLLSNALKYSPEKAQIILSLEQNTLDQNSYNSVFYTGKKFFGKSLEIKVRDNGKGIRPDQFPQIFNRFFVDHSNGETGTGIGLHICQEYVRLHGGNIMVISEPGKGSTFIINIPVEGRSDYEKENLVIQTHFDPLPEAGSVGSSDADSQSTNRIILYAEDNDEMRIYLKKFLATKFKVVTAKNGHQALEIASEVIPDVIITDVLMPGMDGMELTDAIRSTTETSDIPVIILTALSEDHHKIESMKKGAHTFITKPVDESFLLAKIENILREREELKRRYGESNVEASPLPGTNISFVRKAEEIVETNLRNPAFEISEFASQLSISKSSLQRKIKAATSLNPSEFIRDFRLKKAVELIKQGDLNVDEIGLLVGFNSTSYFIRTFKNKYGKTPLAFKAEYSRKE